MVPEETRKGNKE